MSRKTVRSSRASRFAAGASVLLLERLGDFRIEIEPHGRGMAVTVCGAERVISLSETSMELLGAGRRVGVSGHGLRLTVLTAHAARVTGRVEGLRLV